VSLRSGAAVAKGLREAGYDVEEVDVTGYDLTLPERLDAVFIALHGAFGEDGKVQALLESRGLPYTGAGVEASRVSFDKRETKQIFSRERIPTPAFELLSNGKRRSLPLPVVTKPPLQGSTIGIHRVFEEKDWEAAFQDSLSYDGEVLVEAFIPGAELTVGLVCDEALPLIEIRAPDGYYDYRAKYTKGQSQYLVPAPVSREETEICSRLALDVYRALNCRGLGRVDIRLTPEGRPYVLELNTIPGFTETSLLPMAAKAAGMDFPSLCDRIMSSATLDSIPSG